jgi:leucyl/phenylalanyl-tRNA--protein transferase
MPRDTQNLSVELLLMAYASGIFPMSESRDDTEIFWVDPRMRGVMPLEGFRMSRSLAKVIRSGRYAVTRDEDFDGVLAGCASRDETWISDGLADIYRQLHACGRAHSLEVWREGRLAGGIFGICLGGAFFGESMFSRERDASKVALAYTVLHLRRGGFRLFDTQFVTPHLESLGGREIPRSDYHDALRGALASAADFRGPLPTAQEVLHLRSQTSYRGCSSAASAGDEATIQPANSSSTRTASTTRMSPNASPDGFAAG